MNKNTVIGRISGFGRGFLGSMVLGAALCGAFADSAWAGNNNKELTQADIPALKSAYYLMDLESDLHRYETSMLIITNVTNRDDFLVNRDELWASREELSYAIASLENNPYAPEAGNIKEITDTLAELLIKCEEYANLQNELIARKSKIDDQVADLKSIFNDINHAQNLISHRHLSEEQLETFNNVKDAGSMLETMMKSYFESSFSSNDMQVFAQQMQNSYNAFSALVENALPAFPEYESSYKKLKKYYEGMFKERGAGTMYFNYLQQKDGQAQTETYFFKTVHDIYKKINKIAARYKANLRL